MTKHADTPADRAAGTRAAWHAGAIRARALLTRRAGPAASTRVGNAASLPACLTELAKTRYGHDLRTAAAGGGFRDAHRAVDKTLLGSLRLLASWQPPDGADTIRVLAAGYELANITSHLSHLQDGRPVDYYHLDALATAWPQAANTRSTADLRAVLAATFWGDPGPGPASAVALNLRLAWYANIVATVPPANRWATGRAALTVARHLFQHHNSLDETAAHRVRTLLGRQILGARSIPDFRTHLKPAAKWALAGADHPCQLSGAVGTWWIDVERSGYSMVHHSRFGPDIAIGVAALLGADAWRVHTAIRRAEHNNGVENSQHA